MTTTDTAARQTRTAARGPLAGKVALITGASSGIGAATAREFARRGAIVILAARREAELDAQVRAITQAGGQALAIPTDVTDEAQVARLVERAQTTYGGVDILINNAGVGMLRSFARTPAEEIAHIMRTNLLGPMLLTHAVLPGMLQRKRGTIIAVASVAGWIAVDPVYSASKYGVRGFMLSLRRQLAGKGIAVAVVSPGFIRTPLNPNARSPFIPGPEVVARAIARLAIHPRREVVVPRFYRIGIWLERALPGVADRALRQRGSKK